MKDYPKNPAELRVFVLDSVLTNVTGFTANDNNVERVINACNKLYAYCGGDEYAPVADDALAKSLEKFSNAMATAMGVAAEEAKALADSEFENAAERAKALDKWGKSAKEGYEGIPEDVLLQMEADRIGSLQAQAAKEQEAAEQQNEQNENTEE